MTLKRVALQALATNLNQGYLVKTNDSGLFISSTVLSGNVVSTADTGYFRRLWQKQGTSVAGTWAWSAAAGQTDYQSVTGEAAGEYLNSTAANNDEYKWANVFLGAGNYSLTFITVKASTRAIIEWLYGTTSLGTTDLYAAVTENNVVVTYTFNLSNTTTADIRVKVSNKGLGSTFAVSFSRVILEKTG